MPPSRCPLPPPFPHYRADRRARTDHPNPGPISPITRLLPSLGVASLLAGCGVIIEIPQDPMTTEGGTDTDTSIESDTSEGLDSGSTGCESDECSPGTDTNPGDSTGVVPPPGDSHCMIPHLIARGGVAEDMQVIDVPGNVDDIHVLVRVTHHEIGDLEIFLQHGDDILTLLSEPEGGMCTGSHVDAIFDDDATELADDTCSHDGSAIEGAVMPTMELRAALQDNVVSEYPWILRVQAPVDPNDPEDLVLESWCIALSTTGSLD